MNAFGLTEKDWETVVDILATCLHIERAMLFGSRAKGSFRAGSDLDLALFGDLTFHDELELSGLFYDSLLPWKVDLLVVKSSTLPQLIEHIQRVGQLIYENPKAEKTGAKKVVE